MIDKTMCSCIETEKTVNAESTVIIFFTPEEKALKMKSSGPNAIQISLINASK